MTIARKQRSKVSRKPVRQPRSVDRPKVSPELREKLIALGPVIATLLATIDDICASGSRARS
jgi:hypothetical protein